MTTPTPTGAPLNILVVDDESNIRKTLSICLETEGHHVTAVSNFQDAVAEASRRSFHMAFVDLRLVSRDMIFYDVRGHDLLRPCLG